MTDLEKLIVKLDKDFEKGKVQSYWVGELSPYTNMVEVVIKDKASWHYFDSKDGRSLKAPK